MLKFYSLIFFTIVTQYINAQTLDYSFVVVGCNRVDDADTTANKPSTANVYQLNRLFSEVASLTPLPSYFFMAGDLVLGYKNDTAWLASQLKGWISLYKNSPLAGTSTKLVLIPGNHETQDKKAGKLSFPAAERTWLREMAEYIPGSNGPKATGLLPGTDSLVTDQSKLTYSMDFKGDHFIMLNTDPVGRDNRVPTNWIEADITAARQNNARHIFAIGHKPAYPSLLVPTDGLVKYPYQRDKFWNALENNHCEAMFSAHNHVWEKQQPHAGKTYQIIAGNGGSNLETAVVPGSSRAYFGYTLVNVYKDGSVKLISMGRDLDPANYSYPAPQNKTTARDSLNITWSSVTSIDHEIESSDDLIILPNPVSATSSIEVHVSKAQNIKLKLFDTHGKEMITIAEKQVPSGISAFTFDPQQYSAGNYQLLLHTETGTISKQFIILK